jgi:hypothetical protein
MDLRVFLMDEFATAMASSVDEKFLRLGNSIEAKEYLEEHGLRLVPNPKYLTPEEIEHIVMPYGRDVDPYEAYRGWD